MIWLIRFLHLFGNIRELTQIPAHLPKTAAFVKLVFVGQADHLGCDVEPRSDGEHGALEAVQTGFRDPAVGFDILGEFVSNT